MSDYLDHLTAKALDLTERIQPRLASLFEPPSAAGRPIAARWSAKEEWAPDEPFPGVASFEAPLSTEESFGRAGQLHPPTTGQRRPAAVLQQQPTGSAEHSMDQPPGQWVNRQPSPLLTPQVVDTMSGPLRTQAGPNPDRTTSTATPTASSLPGVAKPFEAKAARPSHQDTPILAPVTARQEIAGAPSIDANAQESLSALEQIIGRAVDKRAVLSHVPQSEHITPPEAISSQAIRSSTPAMSVVQPHVTLYREPPVSIPFPATAMPEPAPTIKITIGRVDVRAVMPAMPATRTAPARPGPALSLEEYLKQREGGRR
jgi:hypothetical protein